MTDQEVIEMSEEDFENCEREFFNTLGNCTLRADPSSDKRIESILKKTQLDCITKDSADFVVETFGRGLLGITDAVVGMTEKNPKPRKRSF